MNNSNNRSRLFLQSEKYNCYSLNNNYNNQYPLRMRVRGRGLSHAVNHHYRRKRGDVWCLFARSSFSSSSSSREKSRMFHTLLFPKLQKQQEQLYPHSIHNMVIDSQSSRTLTNAILQQRKKMSGGGNDNGNGVHGDAAVSSFMESSENNEDKKCEVQSRQEAMHTDTITITEEESDLFQLLTDVAERYNSETVLRVAGGWVRDKLLAEKSANSERLTSKRKQKSIKINNSYAEYDNTLNSMSNTENSEEIEPATTDSVSKIGKQVNNEVKRSFSESALITSAKPVDIDIAINNMLGREFAELVNEYLSERGEETHKVGVVLTNPEMSKHLETATLSIGNFWIDFVNLRTEVYKEDDEDSFENKGTRVPVSIGIGTPEEDAFRRDLTINALFYNLQSKKVEDFTGSGLTDLNAKIVRTPIDPVQTFLDDPLRVLRSVRFASRLDFLLDPDLKDAVRQDDIQTSLDRKVSRERVGSEVDLMLRSSRPVRAAKLLYDLNLMNCVFPLKEVNDRNGNKVDHYQRGVQLLATVHSYLISNTMKPPVWCKNGKHIDDLTLTDDEETRRLLWYASLFHPYMSDYVCTEKEENCPPGETQQKKQRKGKKSTQSPIYSLLLDELKRPSRDAQSVEIIQQCARQFSELVMNEGGWDSVGVLVSGVKITPNDSKVITDEDLRNDPLAENAMNFRLKTGRILAKCKNLWRAALVLSLCYELHSCTNTAVDMYSTMEKMKTKGVSNSYDHKVEILSQYNAFGMSIVQLNLIGIWNMKLLLDGDEIKSKVLPNLPRGPLFRNVMDKQWDYMVRHPCCNSEMVQNYLREEFYEYI